MPTYQGQVSEEGLIDLVEYIKGLNNNAHSPDPERFELLAKPGWCHWRGAELPFATA